MSLEGPPKAQRTEPPSTISQGWSKHGVRLARLEKRIPHVVPPWWTPPLTHINESAEEAAKVHDTTEP
ncbi:hypothetical protein N7468_004672 [Penicillium chermesinum]|uniref:Uncharacterized protein n=1 Tax=Penicillium chermesinum TaxID=63820 RepID=A0A9W9TTF7_9EURO|nr:uncharacterized protein N7468_004672 [Penicillium chermesinum]KAJ5240053.1 hypothetical protein N7468_004672 [Penicillium chermesinum]